MKMCMINSMTAKANEGENEFKKRIQRRIIFSFLLIIPGIILGVLGLGAGSVEAHAKSFMNGYVTGVGFGLIGAGLVTAIRLIRIYKNPQKLKELRIKETDERNINVMHRAMVSTLFTVEAILFIASVIVGYISFESLVFATLFTVMVGIFIVGVVYYWIYNKIM